MAVNLETVFKSVQELANSKQVPEKYIHPEGPVNTSPPLLDVPEVDLSLIISPTSPARDEELNKLQSGLKSCGCFQVINHGIEDSFLDKMHEISKQFFALPTEEKLKYARTVDADAIEGYGNDSVLSEKQTLDWTDRLYLNVFPEDIRKLQFWPQKPECFREVFEEYLKKLKLLSESLLKAIATSLNVEENCFLDQCGECRTMVARFNFYPPCPRPDVVLGVKPHADGSAITILLQDKEVEGLQVLKDDQWFRVPVVPYGFLINVGDQVEIMSNGIFKSPLHRVVTNAQRERNTLAVFIMPDADVEIGPVEKLINEERPRVYKNVKNYVELFFQYYQKGRRPIEAAMI
ncbi:flavonol synthase/flavanone 3-hydroxylase-like [Lycium ferocissimum]|uniref:flavonol synthase/flavanone 3-hydroxylase-like n=1 Tax=Lycium ferocissimum TaxID=112874 RepID=UPI002815AF54|nr:flavonol synthase/flavanone 3-hydroxylase-like [Lycium ferocissimum]